MIDVFWKGYDAVGINLLDCTLRDGGYINDWKFGQDGIIAIIKKLAQTGIEMIELGFLKGSVYDRDRTVFPDIASFKNVLTEKKEDIVYLGMLDMSSPVPIDVITPNDGNSIDGLRVIFKKNKINEAYEYCKRIMECGYKLFVNFVNTDSYTDKEFIEVLEKFNGMHPYGVTIVDTFGMIKRKHFKRLVSIADNNLCDDIMLCYHAHNNMQQAFGNAEALVEMNIKRDICIDACVFGMGRGAGNLNLELFADYMNENYDRNYNISPILNIMDEYLTDFYRTKFWGYSLPLYLSAVHACHPNYAIYLAEKNTLSVSSFNELLQTISKEDRLVFNKDKAEQYYNDFLKHYVDDEFVKRELGQTFENKKIVLLAPGKSVVECSEILDHMFLERQNTIIISVNYYDIHYKSDYIFISNMRRFRKLQDVDEAKIIATSNLEEIDGIDYLLNYQSYTGKMKGVVDNAGLMAMRFLISIGITDIYVAGMDGYSSALGNNYYVSNMEIYQYSDMTTKNKAISVELKEISKSCNLRFLTPTLYTI